MAPSILVAARERAALPTYANVLMDCAGIPAVCGKKSGQLTSMREQFPYTGRWERPLPEGQSSVKGHGTLLMSKKAGKNLDGSEI